MLIDLTYGQICALLDYFKWGDISIDSGHIDTDLNEVTLFGVMCPYTEKIPENYSLQQVGPSDKWDKWRVIESKNFWCREEKNNHETRNY